MNLFTSLPKCVYCAENIKIYLFTVQFLFLGNYVDDAENVSNKKNNMKCFQRLCMMTQNAIGFRGNQNQILFGTEKNHSFYISGFSLIYNVILNIFRSK